MRHGGFVLNGTDTFDVINVTKADAGHYFCTATNQEGESGYTFVARVTQWLHRIVIAPSFEFCQIEY
jgi:hypothetical protein